MLDNKKIVCVIPARFHSTRFPKKILAPLGGKPLIQWAWDAAKKVSLFDEVLIALEHEETAKVVDSFHGRYVMTSNSLRSGTERLIDVMGQHIVDGDIWVNWQADEPFLDERMIRDLLMEAHRDDVDVWTLRKLLEKEEEIQSPNIVKVVCDLKGFALYFSRLPIPYYRDGGIDRTYAP